MVPGTIDQGRMSGRDYTAGVNTLSIVRRWLLALLLFGLVGAIVELLLLEHYDEGPQFVPLVLIVAAVGVLAWHSARPNARSVRALQVLMVLFVLAGGLGLELHFRGAAEFQLEMDPSQRAWDVFKKAMRAKDPPVLAPGLMVELGLIGLVYAYRHPAVIGSEPASQDME